MPFFVEVDGKIFIGKDDPNPSQCPSCRRLMPEVSGKGKIRCPHCQYQGKPDEFRANFVEIATVRVLVAT